MLQEKCAYFDVTETIFVCTLCIGSSKTSMYMVLLSLLYTAPEKYYKHKQWKANASCIRREFGKTDINNIG